MTKAPEKWLPWPVSLRLPKFQNNLLRCLALASWHRGSPVVATTQGCSFQMWFRLRGAGQCSTFCPRNCRPGPQPTDVAERPWEDQDTKRLVIRILRHPIVELFVSHAPQVVTPSACRACSYCVFRHRARTSGNQGHRSAESVVSHPHLHDFQHRESAGDD